MSIALTSYWRDFVDQMIESGRYNNRSEVIRAGLRSLEEQERTRDLREFEQVFSDGQAGEPDGKTIHRVISRRKAALVCSSAAGSSAKIAQRLSAGFTELSSATNWKEISLA